MARSAIGGAVAALVLSGCATTGEQTWSAAALPVSTALPTSSTMAGRSAPDASTFAARSADDTFLCQVERPTGTNIAYQMCRSVSRIVREKQHAQETIRDLERRSAQGGRQGYE
jgi:hypothetical protein